MSYIVKHSKDCGEQTKKEQDSLSFLSLKFPYSAYIQVFDMAPPAEPKKKPKQKNQTNKQKKTAILLFDCCDFCVSDHSAVEGCRKWSAGVRRCRQVLGRADAMRGLSPVNAACSLNLI